MVEFQLEDVFLVIFFPNMDRKPNVVEFFILGPSMARMAPSRVASQRMGPATTTTTPDSRSNLLQETVGERKGLSCCQVHLNPDSMCSLAHFSDFSSFWQFRVQRVATAMNATGVCRQHLTARTHAHFFSLRTPHVSTRSAQGLDDSCLPRKKRSCL